MLGDGVSAKEGPIRGTAPDAKLVLQSVLDSERRPWRPASDLHDLFRPPTRQTRPDSFQLVGHDGNFGVYDQQANESTIRPRASRHADLLRRRKRRQRQGRQWPDRSQLGDAARYGQELPDRRRLREQSPEPAR